MVFFVLVVFRLRDEEVDAPLLFLEEALGRRPGVLPVPDEDRDERGEVLRLDFLAVEEDAFFLDRGLLFLLRGIKINSCNTMNKWQIGGQQAGAIVMADYTSTYPEPKGSYAPGRAMPLYHRNMLRFDGRH